MAKTTLNHSLRTNKVMTGLKLGAAGWQMGKVEPGLVLAPSVFLYINDSRAGWLWTCSVPIESFIEASVLATSGGWDVQAVRDGLGSLTWRIAAGVAVPDVEGQDAERQLALLASAYAGTTLAFKSAGGLVAGGHFFIACYSHSNESKGTMLRPFAIKVAEPCSILAADYVAELFASVEAGDRVGHPEYFG